MSEIMERLRTDHANFRRLLELVDHEIGLFRQAERPDYLLLRAIIEYFEDYPAQCHHPVEDLVYLKLKARAPETAARIADLEAEHDKESQRLQTFSELIHRVMLDRIIPRETVIGAAQAFILHVRTHLEMEEAHFFSVAEENLADEDWRTIDREISERLDPLFHSISLDQIEGLRDHILDSYHEGP